MVIRLKDTAKLFGITIIACCAVFVCTLFLSYNIDLAAIKDLGYSLSSNNWGQSWIIWVVAGVIFPAVIAITNAFEKKSK